MCQCLEREAAALTVLEFNDTARKPKQSWREANGEGSKEGGKGEGKKRSYQIGCGPGFNYKNNMNYTDSESLHMVLCYFVQINKRGMGYGACVLQLDSYLCAIRNSGRGITNQPGFIFPS